MYILKNALKSITRNKLRNSLIAVIVLVVAISACVSLSIRQAAETTKEEALGNMSITAQISFDRTSAMQSMAMPSDEGTQPPEGGGQTPGGGRDRFDFDTLGGSSLSYDDYMIYTQALDEDDSYYYSTAISLDASGDILPYGTEETETEDEADTDTSSDSGNTNEFEPMGGGFGGGMNPMGGGMSAFMPVSNGDFSITGYSSYEAMLSLFGTDGSCSITDGEMFDTETNDLSCVISDELALYNDLEVGDTIELCNPNYEDEIYTLKISGIYTNATSGSEETSRFSFSDPANNIYMSYGSAESIISQSEDADNKVTDDYDEEYSVSLSGSLAFTYSFNDVESYENFAEEVYELGLSEEYTVSSSDLTAFENSLSPLESLSTMAMWFFLIIIIVGGIILVTLNVFNLRERKYEIGVLTAIGMKKYKVALQFLSELFIVTFVAIIIGAGVGATISVPVTNSLLEGQIESSQQTQNMVSDNFGFDPQNGGKPSEMGGRDSTMGDKFGGRFTSTVEYVDSVSSATNLTVLLQLVAVGLFLTIVSSLVALISIMRYEPLKILSERS